MDLDVRYPKLAPPPSLSVFVAHQYVSSVSTSVALLHQSHRKLLSSEERSHALTHSHTLPHTPTCTPWDYPQCLCVCVLIGVLCVCVVSEGGVVTQACMTFRLLRPCYSLIASMAQALLLVLFFLKAFPQQLMLTC